MKNLKKIIKHSPEQRGSTNITQPLNRLSSQRVKNSSQSLFKKYNQAKILDDSKNSVHNKYRIITEPFDDRMMQISKSYSKITKPRRRDNKFETQHTSIKARQKSNSREKRVTPSQNGCILCKGYQKELIQIREEVTFMVAEKQKWKKGTLLTDEFIKGTARIAELSQEKEAYRTLDQVRRNIVDLMRDIDVLTQIDYPKLFSYSAFSRADTTSPNNQEIEIKLLLEQLRDQIQGQVTLFDEEEDNDQTLKHIIRNLKANLAKCLRQNLQMRINQTLRKPEKGQSQADIKAIVTQILQGLR